MDLVSPTEHICYARCTYCNTVLAVGVPCKRLMDTVTVKCGHCNNLSFLSPRPLVQNLDHHHHHHQIRHQGHQYNDQCRSAQPSSPPSPITCTADLPKPPFVVKPPEKKHRLPSAYNRFMKEEIQRIKAANPDIPHREAFSMAAKNWAKCDPRGSTVSAADSSTHDGSIKMISLQHERTHGFLLDNFDAFKPMERKN